MAVSANSSSACSIAPGFRSARLPDCLLCLRPRAFRIHAALDDIFPAVDWPNVRGISIEIGPANAVLLAILVDPLPQQLGRDPAVGARLALDAHDVGRKSVSIAAAPAAAMI